MGNWIKNFLDGLAIRVFWFIIFVIFCMIFQPFNANANEQNPPVKKSNSEICHAQDSSYYNRTKNFIAYETLKECLEDGGRLPKNYQPKKES